MSDLEIDLLAAKAAGYEVRADSDLGYERIQIVSHGRQGGEYLTEWRPRHDDGDALRLAVKLKMRLEQSDNYSVCYSGTCMATQFTQPHYGDNPCAATRLAITRAAAEIGRNMP